MKLTTCSNGEKIKAKLFLTPTGVAHEWPETCLLANSIFRGSN